MSPTHRMTYLTLVTLLVLAMGALPAMAGTIVGSEHDFSGKSWNTTGEICIVCHTPHNARAGVADAPLWNRDITASTFSTYTSSTLDSVPTAPAGVSKLCLSCHDGTIGLESFGGTTGSTVNLIGGGDLLGTDLSNDHPISFAYDTALVAADGELADPTVTSFGPPASAKVIADFLEGGVDGLMQCSTCHDVHNTEVETGAPKLLRNDNAGSALCLKCHVK